MTEFGGFANMDVEKLLSDAQRQVSQLEELQRRTVGVVGEAQDKDGLVTVEYAADGLRDLRLNPRAMRLASADLADLIKTVAREAAQDLERKTGELMGEVFGEADNPMNLLRDPEAALAKIREAEGAYDRTFDQVMGDLEEIRRRLEQ
ncbi:YbaB/EbfC family nucleoid-associated protein [Sphaerisporangium corydalis]|uniref:YbaB/EbfC family nucleoid-associated protein n=1 Tax=Sphaerisporangium corydalis TaxID=1441875 RepID=A0ABV9E5W7_9ACTN|nr:YbaB/EbfC family nucleoid-associated protein [Sphaerisporangium corydalis]